MNNSNRKEQVLSDLFHYAGVNNMDSSCLWNNIIRKKNYLSKKHVMGFCCGFCFTIRQMLLPLSFIGILLLALIFAV